MTTPADWQKTNEAYLVAALAWLRLRLERLAAHQPSAPALPLPPALPAKKAEKTIKPIVRFTAFPQLIGLLFD